MPRKEKVIGKRDVVVKTHVKRPPLRRGKAQIGDNKMNKTEFRSLFDVVDKDGSGDISFREWESFAKGLGLRPRVTFKQIDKDQNNRVSRDELEAFFWKR